MNRNMKRLHETKMRVYNRERIKFSAFISNMRSFTAAYDFIQALLRLYWENVT